MKRHFGGVLLLAAVSVLFFSPHGSAQVVWVAAKNTQPIQVSVASPPAPAEVAHDAATVGFFGGSSTPICRWYVTGEAIWFKRERSANPVFLADEQIEAGVFAPGVRSEVLRSLTTDDVRFDHEAGFRVLLGYQFDEAWSVEASYFAVNSWQGTASIRNSDPLYSPAAGSLTNSLNSPYLLLQGGNPDQYTVDYRSRLDSAEVNLRWLSPAIGCWSASALGGIRYLRVHEDFALTATDPRIGFPEVAVERTSVVTKNDLIGLQLGGEISRCWGRVELAVLGKAGLFANFAEHRISNTQTNNPDFSPGTVSRLLTQQSHTRWATSLELGLRASYQINDHVVVYAGYEALLVSGLALAPEQLDAALHNDIARSSITPRRTGEKLNQSGRLLYHGPSVGVLVRW
jgi:hypothetical protein